MFIFGYLKVPPVNFTEFFSFAGRVGGLLDFFRPTHGLQSRDHIDIFIISSTGIDINMSMATPSLKTYYFRATALKYPFLIALV